MEKLNKSLDKVLRKWGLRRGLKEKMALRAWPHAAGKKLALRTRALQVKEGILFVQVPNSSWAQHLTFFKATLVQKINRQLRAKIVQDIHFQVGFSGDLMEDDTPGEIEDPGMVLDGEERERIQAMLANFQGETLIREKLVELMEKELLARKKRVAAGWIPCMRCETLTPPDSTVCPLCKK